MATINSSGGNTTLTLSYTAANAKMLNFIDDALKYISLNGYIREGDTEPTPVANLTNQEKADLIELKCKEYIKICAISHHVETAGNTARATATTDTETRYE